MSGRRHCHKRIPGQQPFEQKHAVDLAEGPDDAFPTECPQHHAGQQLIVVLLVDLERYRSIL